MLKEIHKTIMMIVVMFLLGGFVLVGSTDTTTLNDRTQADNESQQRVLQQDPHWSRYSVRKPNKDEQKKQQWRNARCSRSRDLVHFQRETRASPKSPRPGTKQQKAAWKEFGVKPPFVRAQEVAESLRFGVLDEQRSIADVLKDEIQEILMYNTKRIKDATYKVSYCLHVMMNLGPAMKSMFNTKLKNTENRKATEARLTVNVGHIVKALKDNNDITKDSGYTLGVRPLTKGKQRSITPWLWEQLYLFGHSPFKRAVKEQVKTSFDLTTYDSIKEKFSADALEAEASEKLKEWVSLFANDTKGFYDKVPESLSNQVRIFRDKGNQMNALKKHGVDTTEAAEELNQLRQKFIGTYATEMQANMPSRDSELSKAVKAEQTKLLKDIREDKHSWEITVSRQEGVTLQWHLSHMSDYKVSRKSFDKNNHTGARYLLGPSNFVKMPESVHLGYVSATEDEKSGSAGKLNGDAVSMQMILAGRQQNLFTVDKNMPNRKVKQVITRRQNNRHLYTMINVGLGRDPNQPAHLVMGLYTTPELVESKGGMQAPILSSVKVQNQVTRNSTKPRTPRIGPNTKNNKQKANLVKDEPLPNEASPEEVQKYSSPQVDQTATLEAEARARYDAEKQRFHNMTVKQLKEELTKMGASFTSRALKSELIEQMMGLIPPFELWYKAEMTRGPSSPNPVRKSRKKGTNTPPPNRNKPVDD